MPKILEIPIDEVDSKGAAPAEIPISEVAPVAPPRLSVDFSVVPSSNPNFTPAPSVPVPAPKPTISAAPPLTVLDRLKQVVMGGPDVGDTALGRAVGNDFEGQYDKHEMNAPLLNLRGAGPSNPQTIPEGIARGVGEVATGLMTPGNALTMVATGGLGKLVQGSKKVYELMPRAISAVFSEQMIQDAIQKYPEAKKLVDQGNYPEAAKVVTELGSEGLIGLLGINHARGAAEKAISDKIEQHNAEAARRFKQEATKPTYDPSGGELVLGQDAIPVDVDGKKLEIRPEGTIGRGRRPVYTVVDTESGKKVAGGTGDQVQEWLKQARSGSALVPEIDENDPEILAHRVKKTAELVSAIESNMKTAPEERQGELQKQLDEAKKQMATAVSEYESGGPEQPVEEPKQSEPKSTAPAEVKVGAEFQTSSGTVRVKSVDERSVTFEKEGGAGKTSGKLPIDAFSKMVAGRQEKKEPKEAPQEININEVTPAVAATPAASEEKEVIQPKTEVTPEAAGEPREYAAIQKDIDAEETRLDAAGEDVGKLYFPEHANTLKDAPGWKPMPEKLASLYAERDAVQKREDEEISKGVDERLSAVIPDKEKRGKLVQKLTESNLSPSIRGAYSQENWRDIGRIANESLKAAYEDDDQVFGEIRAVLGGTPEKPAIELMVSRNPVGHEYPNEQQFRKAEKIISAALGTDEFILPRKGRSVEIPFPDKEDKFIRDEQGNALTLKDENAVLPMPKKEGEATKQEDQAPLQLKGTEAPETDFREQDKKAVPEMLPEEAVSLSDEDLQARAAKGEKVAQVEINRRLIEDKDAKEREAEQPAREFHSTQVNLPKAIAERSIAAAKSIPASALTENGIEEEPHITVKYGLEDPADAAAVEKALAGEGPIRAKVGKTSIFETEDADVVKLDIESEDLHRLNKRIKEALPTANDPHPNYVPHITLAYVKKGEGKKFAGKSIKGLTGETIDFDTLTFSAKDDTKTDIKLKGQPAKPTSAKASDKSVQDFPVSATVKDGKITVTTKLGRQKIGDISFDVSEWPMLENNGVKRVVGNPVYEQRELIRKKMADAGIADFETDGADQAERIADAHVSAINKALTELGMRPKEGLSEKAARVRKEEQDKIPTSEVQEPAGPQVVEQFGDAVQTDHLTNDQVDQIANMFDSAEGKAAAEGKIVNAPPVSDPAPLPEPADSIEKGQMALADTVFWRLAAGLPLGNNVAFQELADKAFGGTRASGAYDMKSAYDAIEAAVNRLISENIGSDLLAANYKYGIEQLRELLKLLPTQNIRSENQELLQQFSTPPQLSFIAAKVAGITQADMVLEPSAGTGSLLSWAKAAGAIVRGNEIDTHRAKLLEYAVRGSEPTSKDAEFLNATLPADIKPTIVLMNPPFSATGGRVKSNKNQFGYRHVTEALKRLQPGGRLVAILGEGASLGAPNAKDFWTQVRKLGTIRANVGIDGREYMKYGTTFGNRLLIIDKETALQYVERTGKPVPAPVTGEFGNVEEAYAAIEHISADRPAIAGRVSAEVVEPGGAVRGADRPERPVSTERGGQPESAGSVEAPIPSEAGGPEASTGEVQGREPGPGSGDERAAGTSAGDSSDAGEPGAVEPVRNEDLVALQGRKKQDLLQRNEDDSSFVEYVPSIEGLAHPGRLVETKVMASVSPPPITYQPNLPTNLKAPKPLSAAQMESIARAGQQHQQFDDAGYRQGFLLGDGTGVGKGQQLAGIIWDRYRSGQKRALWVSASNELKDAAEGDFRGIGAPDMGKRLHQVSDWAASEKIDAKDGVVFTTYQSLISKAKGEKGQTRLKQIMDWLGPEGVIVFDEAHKAKNAVAGDARAMESKTGAAVVKIQADLPKAYVVYASATSATDVSNLGYLTRLGLWGPGTAFPNGINQFLSEIGAGGVAAMEMISRELKSQGKYLSRSISFKGVSYEEKIHDLTAEQLQTYDTAAEAWQEVLNAAKEQIRENNAEGSGAIGDFSQAFWGEHQRFFRKLLTAMKVPTVMDLIDKALADEKSVFISLIGTGQAQADKALAGGADQDDLDFSPKDSLKNLILENYPVTLYEEYTDEQGNTRKRPVVRDGEIQTNPEAEAKRDELIARVEEDLKLPDNPLDYIIRSYGRDKVAELTGRRKTVERNPDTGKWESVSRAPDDIPMKRINAHEMELFQSGQKRIAIGSKAAGTGISLHADLSAKNQQPRFHIVMELSWSADDQMQSFGRTHRSNQKQSPEYVIVSTNAGGEKRFSSTIARRLESLGALTKGQRDASGGGSVLAKYNFETTQGEQAAQMFYQHMLTNPVIDGTDLSGHDLLRKMGVLKQRLADDGTPLGPPSMDRPDMTNVTRLLNRVLNVEMGYQNAVYNYFVSIFDSVVQHAIEAGSLDTGVNVVRGDHIKLKSAKVIAKDPKSGAETYRYAVETEQKMLPVSSEKIKNTEGRMIKRREGKAEDGAQQYAWMRKSSAPITTRAGVVEDAYNLIFPVQTSNVMLRIPQSQLNELWEPIEGQGNIEEYRNLGDTLKSYKKSLEDYKGSDYYENYYKTRIKDIEQQRKAVSEKLTQARDEQFDVWDAQVDAAPKTAKNTIHMIGGSVMRVWGALKVGGGRMDIRIAYPESGGSITGVVMMEGDVDRVERSLTGEKVERGTESVFEGVLSGKEKINLEGGIRLVQGRLNRQPVIEMVVNDYYTKQFLDKIGVKKERIGYQWKYFIPSDRAVGLPILEKVMKQYPIVEEGGGRNPERGAITIPKEVVESIQSFLKEEGPKRNYSGIGAIETRTVRNLSQLGRASEAAHEAAVRAAASRSQAATILRAAIPEILKQLSKGDVSWQELRLALIESRLQGLRQRWNDMSGIAENLSDEDLQDSADHLIGLLEAMQGRAEMPQDLVQSAVAMRESKDWDGLRDFLADNFADAASRVTSVMEPEWFEAVTNDPGAMAALNTYKKLVEKPMAENHALNEGVFSTALGPLDTYYPLIPVDRKQTQAPGRRLPYRKPKNIANRFATGLAEGYDPTMAAFRDRLAAAVRANDKAALIETLSDNGLLRKLGKKEAAPESFKYRGEEYQASTVELAPARTLIINGKVTHVGATMGVMPRWLERELRPILEREQKATPTVLDRIINAANTFSLAGPADLVFHSANLLGTLVANTPFLDKSVGGKVLSSPLSKKFYAIYKVAMTDPTSAEAAKDLVAMAKVGLIPDKYASETYSEKLAEAFGAERKRFPFTMGPILYGPKGIDIRARLVMYRVAKEINPNATPKELYQFVNQLGNYVPALQGEIERALKSSGFSPFYTAGSTMLRNSINAMTGAGPMPKDEISLRLWQQLTGGAIFMIAMWAFVYHQMTDKWPWEDKRAKLLEIPAPEWMRRSNIGKELWGNGPEVGYLNFGYFNPLVKRGLRAAGITGAFESSALGGTPGQMAEAAQKDTLNSLAHPLLGPIPRSAFVLATGAEPYITGLRDRYGKMAPQFFPAIPPKTAAGFPSAGKRAAAAAAELNSFYGDIGVSAGLLDESSNDKGNKWLRMLIDTSGIGTGAISNASNPTKRAEAVRQQRRSMKRK